LSLFQKKRERERERGGAVDTQSSHVQRDVVQESRPACNMPKIVIHQAALLVTVSIFTLLTIIVVACRLLTRLFIIRNTGRDELAIVFSMVTIHGSYTALPSIK
jgi:hypothetical protein